jgi:AcrR family transcriptional regulator
VISLNDRSVNEPSQEAAMARTRRAQQAEDRRQQLLDVALALFAERGFENTSIKDVCAAAGVAPGLVYHYFRSKDELLAAILAQRHFQPELRRLAAAAPDRPAAEVLPEVAARFDALLGEREALLRLAAREMHTNPAVAAAVRERADEGAELLAGYLEARIRAGELRPHDPRVTARALAAMVVMLRLTRTPADAFLPAFVDILLRGIAAR